MGTNCAPLVADLFLFCYERDCMLSLSDSNQTDIIEAFNSTSRYPTELQLNKDNSPDTEVPFLDLNLSLSNEMVLSKIMISWMILILK